MSRPIKEGLEYFPHDTDAITDEKIEVLTSLYGNDGYAFYFIMLERIYRNAGCMIDISDEEKKEEIFLILRKKMRLSQKLFEKILKTALKYNLFDEALFEKGIITSDAIQRRASVVLKKRKNMQLKHAEKKVKPLNPLPENQPEPVVSAAETRQETLSETPQSKEKKSKENHHHYHNDVKGADDDFGEQDEIFKRLMSLGLSRDQAKQVLAKYERNFIGAKLDQIAAKSRDQPIKNMPAYLVKTFANAEFECHYETQKQLKAEESRQKKQKEIEAKQQKESLEAEENKQFLEITDRLKAQSGAEDRQAFLEQVIGKNVSYRKFFNEDGFDSLIIDSVFRQFLLDRHNVSEERSKRNEREINQSISI